jgi:hypothetical protein
MEPVCHFVGKLQLYIAPVVVESSTKYSELSVIHGYGGEK